ncbi:isoprenoid synthase domain-containing protein [Coprinopsis sp. MPI-PUGE-AT-0042]|nr:isoprenoid synthase domain-containing protein [Coprinopsis sp. MPI-PUGE-AT-0042]
MILSFFSVAFAPIAKARLSYKVAHYNRSAIKDVIVDFFDECNVPYQIIPFDDALFNACLDRAVQKGYPVASHSVGTGFIKSLKVGVTITRTSYGHLPDYESLIWMALWTAFVTYADDAFQDDIHHLQSFARTFLQNERHEHPVLEAFASFLRECSITFPHFVANTVISSALRFMMSIALEFEGQTSKVSSEARDYPQYVRLLSGLSDVFTLFAFPSTLPISTYIQCWPEQIGYIDATNDVLSFYKEDLDGETVNFISATAASRNVSKLEVLKSRAQRAKDCHDVVMKVLAPYPEAVKAWQSFAEGFCHFHTSSPRYRLGEMFDVSEHDIICQCAQCSTW